MSGDTREGDDVRQEFAELVRGFRGYAERMSRGGSYGVERGLAEVVPTVEPAPVETMMPEDD